MIIPVFMTAEQLRGIQRGEEIECDVEPIRDNSLFPTTTTVKVILVGPKVDLIAINSIPKDIHRFTGFAEEL